jgi:lysophospholipase L1-like esterase
MRPLVLCALLLAGAASPALAQSTQWTATWAAAPAPPQEAGPGIKPYLVSPTLEDQTLVQVMRVAVGGSAIRIRFSNEYGLQPLAIRAARISVLDDAGRPGPSQAITFGGAASIDVPPKAPMVSDAVPLKTKNLVRLRIALHVAGKPTCTCHVFGLETVEVSPPGDFTDRAFKTVVDETARYRAFITRIDVETAKRPVIVALGDSITDGVGSTPGADQRWPDLLARRFATVGGRAPSIVNAGIGGNRLNTGDPFGFKGENALARLDRDVLAIGGVTHIILLEGINDIGSGGAKNAETLIAGYRQVIARAHARGVKVIGATLTPFLGFTTPIYYRPVGEPIRQKVNDWIRASGEFDGVIDFDAAVRDPAAPTQMRANFHSGDWLHPNDAGYRAMADAVDLKLFR